MFLGLFAFWRCGSTAYVPYACCKTGLTSCLDYRRGQMVTARIVTKNKFTAENRTLSRVVVWRVFLKSQWVPQYQNVIILLRWALLHGLEHVDRASQAVLLVAQEPRSQFKLQHHKRSRRRPNKRWNQCFGSQVHYVAPETWNDAS